MKRRFGDWRDEAADAIAAIYTEAVHDVWPAIVAARAAGEPEMAERIARNAMERVAPHAATEFELHARRALASGAWRPDQRTST